MSEMKTPAWKIFTATQKAYWTLIIPKVPTKKPHSFLILSASTRILHSLQKNAIKGQKLQERMPFSTKQNQK